MIELIGGGERADGPNYFNMNFESHGNFSVKLDNSQCQCLEADVNCSLVRISDPKGREMWMLGDKIIPTTILRGFVEISE